MRSSANRMIISLGFVALLASGCSTGAGPTAGPATSTASASPSVTATPSHPSPTASPSPTVMTVPEAKVAYLAAVCPANKTSDGIYSLLAGKYPSQINRKKVRALSHTGVTQLRVEYLAFTQPKLP